MVLKQKVIGKDKRKLLLAEFTHIYKNGTCMLTPTHPQTTMEDNPYLIIEVLKLLLLDLHVKQEHSLTEASNEPPMKRF